ncbi:MAG: hypothetical protein R3D80_14705 [Paracoccaceae bacterium]
MSVTTGTSSTPLPGLISGMLTPGGILSMLDWILSLSLTSDSPICSPTSNCTVTIAPSRAEVE